MARPPWETFSDALLAELLCDDSDACRFVRDVAFTSNVYDDLIDGDAVSQDFLHRAFFKLLITIPENPFYQRHQVRLRTVLATGLLNWLAANDMQASGSKEELRIAHAIRYSIGDVLLLAMELTGGHEHAARNARRARLMLQADTWADYAKEHGHG